MTAAERLKEEVEERVRTMRETEGDDEEWTSARSLERTALTDILELPAKDHVAYSTEHRTAFVKEWKALQGAARKRLKEIQQIVNEVDIVRGDGEEDTLVLCTDCEGEGGLEDFATVKERRPIPASCDRCDWRARVQ